MSLRLAPYNDAMRLGQGFNSYTHELCIDSAVDVRQRTVNQDTRGGRPNPSQVASYSARSVEKLSDIVEAMNLSYSSSIKKGTIEISGNSTSVDENTFKLSDLNVVVSIRVVNQTITIEDQSTFVPLTNQEATAARFNEIYGDSYVSGFIEGGDFSGIVSIKVIDRSNVSNVVNTIKASLLSTGNSKNSPEAADFTLGPSGPLGDNIASTELSAALKGTETTISINWMGGGQIKEPAQHWDIDSLYAAAAAFPASVAQCPQRTWAILTPYKANRSFISWNMQSPVKILQYDLIANYTAELFDRFMDYKLLLKRAQHILSNRKLYRQRIGIANAIGTEVATLLCLRAALRNEQTKIVEAIEVLAKDPNVLKRQAAWTNGHQSEVVRRIVEKALGEFKDWHPITTSAQPAKEAAPENVPAQALTRIEVSMPPVAARLNVAPEEAVAKHEVTEEGEERSVEEEEVGRRGPSRGGMDKPAAHEGDLPASAGVPVEEHSVNHPASSVQPGNPGNSDTVTGRKQTAANDTASAIGESADFNFDTLIAPEVWEDLLPEPLEPISIPLTITAPVTSVGPLIGPGVGGLTSFILTAPPADDETGPGSMVITTESYTNMEKELKESKHALAMLKASQKSIQATKVALEQTARQETERAATFEQQAKSAISDLQIAQRTIEQLNGELLSFKANTATRIDALEKSLATATGLVETQNNTHIRDLNTIEDLRGRINNFRNWWDGPVPWFKPRSVIEMPYLIWQYVSTQCRALEIEKEVWKLWEGFPPALG